MKNDPIINNASADPADSCAVSPAQCPGRNSGAGIPAGKGDMRDKSSIHRARGKAAFENRIRMVALDMDGTLLMSDKSLHPDTPADISAASRRGIEVVYCTGRAVPEIIPYREALPEIRYAVCLSGAYVFDLQEQRGISATMIDPENVQKIVEEGERLGAMVQFLTQDQSILRADLIERAAEFHMGVFRDHFRRTATPAADMLEEAGKHGSVPKINLYFHTPEERRQAYENLKMLPLEFSLLEEGTTLEMTAAGTTKAFGLHTLADYLGIPMKEIMAIGDSENDRQVLESAGFSVAPGNASAEIRKICDAVTDDNDHNGVGKAIRKYCF